MKTVMRHTSRRDLGTVLKNLEKRHDGLEIKERIMTI